VDGEASPDITFDETDPPVGGLRTWPQIRHITPTKLDTILKLTNIESGIKTAIKETTSTTTKVIFGALLKTARDKGTYFSIQAHSQSPYR
jgi:hypothetical protein